MISATYISAAIRPCLWRGPARGIQPFYHSPCVSNLDHITSSINIRSLVLHWGFTRRPPASPSINQLLWLIARLDRTPMESNTISASSSEPSSSLTSEGVISLHSNMVWMFNTIGKHLIFNEACCFRFHDTIMWHHFNSMYVSPRFHPRASTISRPIIHRPPPLHSWVSFSSRWRVILSMSSNVHKVNTCSD